MYEWQLTRTLRTTVHGPNIPPVHRTRQEMIEPVVRAALRDAGPNATALDLACNEGWFSHRLLEWGASRVLGVDLREQNIRRAQLVQDHFAVPRERLEFVQSDVFDLDPADLGTFDVTLVLGLIYHLERPLEALRLVRRLTTGLSVIESQLTQQTDPIVFGDGTPHAYRQSDVGFAAWMENRPDNLLASAAGVMSLVPNRAALEAMPRWAGFSSVTFLEAQPHHDPQYVGGDRAIVAARAT